MREQYVLEPIKVTFRVGVFGGFHVLVETSIVYHSDAHAYTTYMGVNSKGY